jgi:hypothetical protein
VDADPYAKLIIQVGYAFVNFVDVKALYHFIQAKVNKKWNMFSSEKVLQVSYSLPHSDEADNQMSYANIQ